MSSFDALDGVPYPAPGMTEAVVPAATPLARGSLGAPEWARELVGVQSGSDVASSELRCVEGERFALVSVCIPTAAMMDADGLRHAVRDAYLRLAETIVVRNAHQLVRVWNFIPGILEPLGTLEHRYMAFNAGRHDAYAALFGGGRRFATAVPTASGVGHDGDELLIHALASVEAGEPVENPRQVPSYRYSIRYGPLPPSFARATRIRPRADEQWLLVGGTASVRGEETVHVGDLEAQADETLDNLAAVVAAAPGGVRGTHRADLLGRYRHLRVYHVSDGDRDWVGGWVTSCFAGVEKVELARADLCRDGLLVEVEGVAELGA